MTEWRPVPGWEGLYEVSSDGRVRSLSRRVRQSRWPTSTGRTIQTRELKIRPDKRDGYARVGLCRDGRHETHKVHRLVALAFLADSWFPGAEVCHGIGGPFDNRVENLRWDTPSENQLDRRRHGTDPNVKKTHCPRGHLLAEPNLMPSCLRKGQRTCLACNRACTRRSYQRRRHGAVVADELLQEWADRQYERIMGVELE